MERRPRLIKAMGEQDDTVPGKGQGWIIPPDGIKPGDIKIPDEAWDDITDQIEPEDREQPTKEIDDYPEEPTKENDDKEPERGATIIDDELKSEVDITI